MINDPPEIIKNFLPYLHTILLAAFGGVVHYLGKTKDGHSKFNWREFSVDIVSSAFAGLLTFYLCMISDIDGYHASVLIAISGHMGTRAIELIERLYGKFLGLDDN